MTTRVEMADRLYDPAHEKPPRVQVVEMLLRTVNAEHLPMSERLAAADLLLRAFQEGVR